MDDQHKIVISELTKLLMGGGAHASFHDAIKGLNPELRGVKANNMPYSIWQLVEHIRSSVIRSFDFTNAVSLGIVFSIVD